MLLPIRLFYLEYVSFIYRIKKIRLSPSFLCACVHVGFCFVFNSSVVLGLPRERS
jgi:hypothetical protein